jgi:hypothetical protein
MTANTVTPFVDRRALLTARVMPCSKARAVAGVCVPGCTRAHGETTVKKCSFGEREAHSIDVEWVVSGRCGAGDGIEPA